MRFINAIELPPFNYAKSDYQSPMGSTVECPKEWSAYWHRSLSDSNLGHLVAIKEGSFLVDVNSMDEDALSVVIEKELEEIELEEYEDQIAKLAGGIVVIEGEVILQEPMCCCDMDSCRDLLAIVESEEDTWIQLWIGHPWVFYRRRDGKVEFSDYTNDMLEEEEIRVKWSIIEEDLVKELEQLDLELVIFKQKVNNVLIKKGFAEADNMATIMVGVY
ncbi:hypothetical protein [Myroides odoratimimus]|uniref:hypothetical protein n=1 Tax=Myroides odoratimimus TaxID=76832 RepID=UPI000469CFC3|nr:hypothetical protein [Myroides odoratimimus]